MFHDPPTAAAGTEEHSQSEEPIAISLHTVEIHDKPGLPLSDAVKIQTGEMADQNDSQNPEQPLKYMEGWRLPILTLAISLSLLLAGLETTIVGTSLVSITDDLKSFSKSSWVVTAYLLTYTSFMILIGKLSDIFSRRLILLSVLIIFTVFSIGCGLAQSMTALIALRAFQGLGGGGINAMAYIIVMEMVPPSKYAAFSSLLSSVGAFANLIGPLVGGLITTNTSRQDLWRWVFLINGPFGAIALILAWITLPSDFSYTQNQKIGFKQMFSRESLQRIDVIGAMLISSASILLITAVEEGGTQYSWHNAVTITLLTISLILWPCFLAWERRQETAKTLQEAVFPWRLIVNRFSMGVLLNSFFAGGIMTTVAIQLPQRFQIVNATSPFKAAYRLLAFTLTATFGAGLGGALMQRTRLSPFYILLVFGALETIGLVLLSYMSGNLGISPSTYGYEVIGGLGVGGTFGTAILMVPLVVSSKDLAVGVSGIWQLRALGGAICLAISTNLLNHKVTSALKDVLTPDQLANLLMSAGTIPSLLPSQQELVRRVYSQGFSEQMKVAAVFGGLSIGATLMLWEKNLRKAQR